MNFGQRRVYNILRRALVLLCSWFLAKDDSVAHDRLVLSALGVEVLQMLFANFQICPVLWVTLHNSRFKGRQGFFYVISAEEKQIPKVIICFCFNKKYSRYVPKQLAYFTTMVEREIYDAF